MATCLRTHRLTHTPIKPPTAGVQLVGHTSIIYWVTGLTRNPKFNLALTIAHQITVLKLSEENICAPGSSDRVLGTYAVTSLRLVCNYGNDVTVTTARHFRPPYPVHCELVIEHTIGLTRTTTTQDKA